MRWEKHIALWKGRRPRSYQARVDMARSLGYVWVGAGATRDVYLSPDKSHVVKIQFPDCEWPRQNWREASFYKKWSKLPLKNRKNKTQFAKCKMVKGLGVFMEAVDCIETKYNSKEGKHLFYRASDKKEFLKIPKWVFKDRTLDGWQVGITKDKRLVVYDYGVAFGPK